MRFQLSLATGWSPTEMSVLSRCLGQDGIFKSSRPTGESRYDKWAYYVWRNLMFYLRDVPEHQCMPVLCYFELPNSEDSKALDQLVDKVMALIPPKYWVGVARWKGSI